MLASAVFSRPKEAFSSVQGSLKDELTQSIHVDDP